MRFLADESCHFAIVRALRAAGHDVRTVVETARGARDPAVIELARREERLLLTEDRDFGRLIFADAQPSGGVVYLRYPAGVLPAVIQALGRLVRERGDELPGAFVVVEPGRIRLARQAGD